MYKISSRKEKLRGVYRGFILLWLISLASNKKGIAYIVNKDNMLRD